MTSEQAVPPRARTQGLWGMFDQLLASVSSFVVIIVAARSLAPSSFGAFSVAFEVMVFSLFVIRGLGSDSLSSAHANDSREALRLAARSGASTVVAAGTAIALVLVLLSRLLNGELASALLALALVIPGFALQDFLRYVLLIQGRARSMFINDLVWVVLMLPFLWYATTTSDHAYAVVLAWGLAGNLAGILGVLQSRTRPGTVRHVRDWLRDHRHLWPYFLLDNFIFQSGVLILVVVLSIATTLEEVGALRAAMTVFAPISVVGRGFVGIAVPVLARRQATPLLVRRGALLIAFVLGPFTLLYAFSTLLISDSVGRFFLGDSWTGAEPLLVLAGVTTAAGMVSIGAAVGLRALAAGRDGLTARIIVTALALGCAATGAVIDGAHGVFVALAFSAPFEVTTWLILLNRATHKAVAKAGPADDPPID